MDQFISTFHIDWRLMIAQVINFGLVFLALYFLASKPLKKLIADRTEEITTGILNAKQNKELLQNTEKEYNEAILKAKMEADKIFKEAKNEALLKKNEMLEQAKVEVTTMIDAGKKSLEGEKQKMIVEAKKEIVSLVVGITEKVVGKEATPSLHANIIKELESLPK